jgi:peptidoglycan/xylan/chitin deacetylase (PgdA/CDA1 family)
MREAVFTTSWDDGHPLDLRIAGLLAKYGLVGTFYVPTENRDRAVMKAAEIRELSRAFEIGGHTLHHIPVVDLTDEAAREEILAGKRALESTTGQRCRVFCFPLGRFRQRHLHMVRDLGFEAARTVELMSRDYPRQVAGLALLPTSVLARPAGHLSYLRNCAKRFAFSNFRRYLVYGSRDWVRAAEGAIRDTAENGGVFHLWGHSWEIDQDGQWSSLEHVLRYMSEFKDRIPCLTNGRLAGLILR